MHRQHLPLILEQPHIWKSIMYSIIKSREKYCFGFLKNSLLNLSIFELTGSGEVGCPTHIIEVFILVCLNFSKF